MSLAEQCLAAQQATAKVLGEAGTLAEAMPRILGALGSSLGWVWAASWRVDREAGVLRFDASWHVPGTPLPDVERLSRAATLRCGTGLPGRVWATGRPAWIPEVAADDDRPRAWSARAVGLRTAFGFPIVVEREVVGVVEVFSASTRPLDEGLVALMASIAEQIGQFKLRIEAAAETKRLAFLANAGALLVASLDYESTLALLPQLVVPTLADWCLVELAGPDGREVCVAVAHADPGRAELARELRSVVATEPGGSAGPVIVAEVTAAALAAVVPGAEQAALIHRAGARSLMRIPLSARGRPLGRLTLLRTGTGPAFEPADLTLAAELAWRAAVAIDKAWLQRETEEAVRVRDKVLSIVSHDLVNPLQVIDLNTRLLAEALPGDGSRETVERARGLARIGRAALRMRTLIRELLDVAHLQAGQPLVLERSPTDLVALVRQLVGELAQEWTDRTVELEASVPELWGDFDGHRIERVVANLLSNAAKYGAPGGLIHVEVTGSDSWAEIQVADSGMGIVAADLPHIFDLFRRGQNVGQRIGGSGIGLASARQVVLEHGGTLTVESTEGEGSTFTVRLPRDQLPSRSSVAGADRTRPSGS